MFLGLFLKYSAPLDNLVLMCYYIIVAQYHANTLLC